MPEPDLFQPNWFSPPGATISDKLHSDRIALQDFAWEMDLQTLEAEKLIEGEMPITPSIAGLLERALGINVDFWLTREAHYRRDLETLARRVPAEAAKIWLKELPLKDMIALGWVHPAADDQERVAECFRYFDVASLEAWNARIEGIFAQAKLRSSRKLQSVPASLAAWLRRGEMEAELVQCGEWDGKKFEAGLEEVRKLTLQKNPETFLPRLKQICAASGVVVVVAKTPSGCRASGATRFLSDRKALLMLSFRYLSDDHFWFTFFHEAAHLCLHGSDRVFLEGEPHTSEQEEQEANEFSERILIPDELKQAFESLTISKKEILRFSAKAGISPGIVVGQLQHRGRLNHNFFNYFKRRYVWV